MQTLQTHVDFLAGLCDNDVDVFRVAAQERIITHEREREDNRNIIITHEQIARAYFTPDLSSEDRLRISRYLVRSGLADWANPDLHD